MKRLTSGERLRALRGSRSQEEVATALGISQSALCAYEMNQRTPRDEVKKRIAKYYKRSVQFIFFDTKSHET
jgi:transcriptional regulator with XRE-family HTH domain